ncbi:MULTISPECIES: EVE domain-containing protein [unclassified Meiothermus]|uniref:EVE domain-containing protein n=1 Tax=unclassified Meiothermus TaxID=370471 RepID=UPI000D7BCF66|nr:MULTISPECIES: EVE domain-containing protein [unclassified Meiothermus]PZA08255.1 EVE domain-containing protein [Meiothermus sp. Pnk-1]RYM38997.1 EVE domain-containing protein [Meiothermus sp. PNK-Is4]
MAYWLLKSEPEVYSIHDLARQKTTVWDGVRNYQARNFLRAMQVGDLAFFYHSNTASPGIAGLCRVIESEVVDPTQFDPRSDYFDPRSRPDHPRWWTVRVEFVQAFANVLGLEVLRAHFSPEELWTLRRGNRLSVMPVGEAVAQRILALAKPWLAY